MPEKTLSIIICAFNEKDTILQVLENVHSVDYRGWTTEIVVVDNKSTDGTRELLEGVDYPDTRVIFQPQNMGKGTSVRTAIDAISGDYAVIQDADLEYNPHEIPKLLMEAENDVPVIFGSRVLGGHVVYEYAHAYLGVRIITTIMNILFGGNLTDSATATKMVRVDILKALNLIGSGFDLDFELPDKLLLAGYKIKEVRISYDPRTYEEGKKIKAKDGLRAFKTMLRDRLGLSPIWKDPIKKPADARR